MFKGPSVLCQIVKTMNSFAVKHVSYVAGTHGSMKTIHQQAWNPWPSDVTFACSNIDVGSMTSSHHEQESWNPLQVHGLNQVSQAPTKNAWMLILLFEASDKARNTCLTIRKHVSSHIEYRLQHGEIILTYFGKTNIQSEWLQGQSFRAHAGAIRPNIKD